MEKDYKRKCYITWDQYFMAVALITSQRSKDPVTQATEDYELSSLRGMMASFDRQLRRHNYGQFISIGDSFAQVGTCIVNENNRIVSTGYNGMPNGCADSDMPWGKHHKDNLRNKTLFVCHSELNAILNTRVSLKDCRIYVTLFPCNECAKVIIQSGIKEIVYYMDTKSNKESTKASKIMLQKAEIKTRQYIPTDLVMTIGQFKSKL